MVDVICDTSFLMILASKRIKNISNLDTEIGNLDFVVPNMVVNELKHISVTDNKKKATQIML